MFDSLGFAYDFAFCQNKWSLKIFQNVLWSMSFKNANIYQSFLGAGSNKNIKKNRGLVGPNLTFYRSFRKSKSYFLRMFPDTFFYLLRYFGIRNTINTGSTGPEMTINRSKN